MGFFLLRKTIRRLPGVVIKAVPLPNPNIHKGFGERKQVGKIAKEKGYRSVLLVTDETIFSLGFHKSIVESLEAENIACTVFHEISSEPTEKIINEGRMAAKACGAECIVALGGGSVMDSCKIIATSARSHLGTGFYLRKFVLSKTLPLITIPSTAGTGAEITVGSVVKNKKGIKRASVVVGLNIEDVILDSELTVNAPADVTIYCAIDALSHGLEGCLADVTSSEEDRQKSSECVRLVLDNLPKVLGNPQDTEARQNLALAAHYGGNAINKQLAGYVHAFAHTIGAKYHMPHGLAIAHCLIPVLRAQKTECEKELKRLAVYCKLADEKDEAEKSAEKIILAISEFEAACGFKSGLLQMEEKDYPSLLKGINEDSINYSPKKTLSDKEITRIMDDIKRGI